MSQTQLERDIAFCIDICGMEDHEIGDMLRACERLGGIAVEYFCEEFVFIPFDDNGEEDVDSLQNCHDDDKTYTLYKENHCRLPNINHNSDDWQN